MLSDIRYHIRYDTWGGNLAMVTSNNPAFSHVNSNLHVAEFPGLISDFTVDPPFVLEALSSLGFPGHPSLPGLLPPCWPLLGYFHMSLSFGHLPRKLVLILAFSILYFTPKEPLIHRQVPQCISMSFCSDRFSQYVCFL